MSLNSFPTSVTPFQGPPPAPLHPPAGPSRKGRWRWLALGVPAALLATALVSGCGGKTKAKAPKEVEVVVTTPISYDRVADYQDFTGRLSAVKNIELRPRVTGYVVKTHFKEGDVVEKGALLFEIDPDTYQADLNQAKANYNLAVADRNLQRKITTRARELVTTNSMAREEYDTDVATLAKSRATVKSMAAARRKAELYLGYTKVRAPFRGRISRRYVDPGNLVNADQTILTSIVTEDPLYAYFDVNERTYLDLVMASGASQSSWFSGLHFPVLMRLANQDHFRTVGTVDFVDNQVIATTGTVRLRGVFKNTDRALKPGLFVRIRLPLGNPYRALLIPDEALQSDQGRNFIYVLNKDNEVVYRRVELGRTIRKLRVIKKGLKKGERFIVKGMQRVRPGLKVLPTLQKPPRTPKNTLGDVLLKFQKQRAANNGQVAKSERQK
jgi:RND family efflux transporter MFP subunit